MENSCDNICYEDAYHHIITSYALGKKQSKQALRGVLALLGNPHKGKKYVHAAGTNGKGSVCAYIASALQEAGYNVGLYGSPHLNAFNERFKIDGEDISNGEMARHIGKVMSAEKQFFGESGKRLSYFNLLTLCAFTWFDERKPDYIVLETGLGGRLDTTNIIGKPLVSVITKISLDHVEQLGGTVEKIAAEKAGIIKKNGMTALYHQDDNVYDVIHATCEKRNNRLLYPDDLAITVSESGTGGTTFSVKCKYFEYKDLRLSMPGIFQTENAACALTAIEALRGRGVNISDEAIREGLRKAFWPGRMEIFTSPGKPDVILDGAHNSDKIVRLRESVERYYGGREITVVFAAMKDKSFGEMAAMITGTPGVKRIYITQPVYKKRAAEPGEIAIHAAAGVDVILEPDHMAAIESAIRETGAGGVVCVCGSLYLVGDVRGVVMGIYDEQRDK